MFIMSLVQIVQCRGNAIVFDAPPSPLTHVDLEDT